MTDQYVSLGETLYFHAAIVNSTGAAQDASASASYSVRRCGHSADAAPIFTAGPALLSHASYPDGLYEISLAATTANGFSAGESYAVFMNATVSNVNATGFVGRFKLAPVYANVKWVNDSNAGGQSLSVAITQIATIVGDTAAISAGVSAITSVVNRLSASVSSIKATVGRLSASSSAIKATVGRISASVSAIAVDTANISAGVSAVASTVGRISASVSAIKTKTGSLNFTVAGQVDANVQYVNDVLVTGTGTAGDPWGP